MPNNTSEGEGRDKSDAEWARKREEAQKQVDAREEAIRKLEFEDQDALFERWKAYRKNRPTGDEYEKFRHLNLHFRRHPHPEVTRLENLGDAVDKAMEEQLDRAIPARREVIYCAHENDELGFPVDNLDEIAVTGRVYFLEDPAVTLDLGEEDEPCPVYTSPVVENPTWLQVAQMANEMLLICGPTEHVFLENIYVENEIDGVKRISFCMGS